ncbi:hypothetical protein CEXT_19621 [Caerostris extrusa]|uniref:Uncharacterized protein n=1 Tax=Caerostris extrusa TaxID=172846 RepID=A0AAV4TNW7_CAEEX|nr:hypothetical protein CEXT_19621 [Caerostris extrusa]
MEFHWSNCFVIGMLQEQQQLDSNLGSTARELYSLPFIVVSRWVIHLRMTNGEHFLRGKLAVFGVIACYCRAAKTETIGFTPELSYTLTG